MKRKILILAGGKGTRMTNHNGGLPKVLTRLSDKPIILHLLDSLSSLQSDSRIGIVVGYKADEVKNILGPRYDYYLQEEQHGTGHAVQCAAKKLRKENVDQLVVLYGDQPFIQPKSVQKIMELQTITDSPICMMTVKLSDFLDWREAFLYWGRILRADSSDVIASREYKDCSKEEQEITEVNPSIYCFDTSWLWKNLDKLQNNNAQEEYYLTDLIEICIKQRHMISTISISAEECMGINSPKELTLAETILYKVI